MSRSSTTLANLPFLRAAPRFADYADARSAGALLHVLTPRRLRDRAGPPRTLARIGALEARLARTTAEVRLAQSLRYRVFYGEMDASPGARALRTKRDADRFDAVCDHVLVVDHDAPPVVGALGRSHPAVVGTYRHENARKIGGFYTSQEYDLDPLLAANAHLRFVELGRSCVLASHRNRRALEVLWAGVWAYVRHHRLDAMIGCASFPGTDPHAHALALSFLHHHAAAAEDWRLRALPQLHVPMDMLPADAVSTKAALRALPPLVKGYLRLGARVGEGAVIDRQFGTVDVCMVLQTSDINPRYFEHFGHPDAPVAAA